MRRGRRSRDGASAHPADIDPVLRAFILLLNLVVALSWASTAFG